MTEIVWNTNLEPDLLTKIEDCKVMLAHWESKTPEFWENWQGHDRETILNAWRSELEATEQALEAVQAVRRVFQQTHERFVLNLRRARNN